jgi:uncharacterized membrane protein YphA (DoxX/SURF4 family)
MSQTIRVNILSILLALGFIFFGVQKFGAENIVFERLAARSGIDLFEPFVRMMTGGLEIIAAIMLLIPKLRVRFLGAFLGLGIIGGAIIFHLSPWLGINVPGIGHFLFVAALIMFVLLLLLLAQITRKSGDPHT